MAASRPARAPNRLDPKPGRDVAQGGKRGAIDGHGTSRTAQCTTPTAAPFPANRSPPSSTARRPPRSLHQRPHRPPPPEAALSSRPHPPSHHPLRAQIPPPPAGSPLNSPHPPAASCPPRLPAPSQPTIASCAPTPPRAILNLSPFSIFAGGQHASDDPSSDFTASAPPLPRPSHLYPAPNPPLHDAATAYLPSCHLPNQRQPLSTLRPPARRPLTLKAHNV